MLSGDDSTKKLFTAIMFDDLATTRAMISEVNINVPDCVGMTPILLAVRSEAVNVIEYLLTHPHIDLQFIGTQVFEEALRYYFMSARVFSEGCELSSVLTLLNFQAYIDFEQAAIKKLLADNPGDLSTLIILINSLRDNNINHDYFEFIFRKVKTNNDISLLFSKFNRSAAADYWLHQAAITALGEINKRHPEPLINIPGIEQNPEFLNALQAAILFYQKKTPGLHITKKQAHDACMVLCTIYQKSNLNMAKYFHIAKEITADGAVNSVSQQFIDVYTRHYSENHHEKTISMENTFSHKVKFILNLREATAIDSTHARAYLEKNITNRHDLISILSEAVLNNRFDEEVTSSILHPFKLLYGQQEPVNYSSAIYLFDFSSFSAYPAFKFYSYFMLLIAFIKMQRINPQVTHIKEALTAFQNMLPFYSDNFAFEYHLEIFDMFAQLLKMPTAVEYKVELFKMMMQYTLVLLRTNDYLNAAKLSEFNMQQLCDFIFSIVEENNLLNDIQNWTILISYINDFLSVSKRSPIMINNIIQNFDILRADTQVAEFAKPSIMRHFIATTQFYLLDLDMDSIQLAISNLQSLLLGCNDDNENLLELITGFHLRAALLVIEERPGIIPDLAIKHAIQALNYAVYPEQRKALDQIEGLLSMHLNLKPDDVVMKLIANAQQALRSSSDASLAELVMNNYFPALIKLTYKHMQANNVRRALYLCTRLSVELLLNKNELTQTYHGLTEDSIATLKKDIYRYLNSFQAGSKYTYLVDWYTQIIKLIATLSVNNSISAKGLDIDALLYGNSKQVAAIRDAVKYGMSSSLNKYESYYDSKAAHFAALRADWEDKIMLNQPSPVAIEMGFWRKTPANIPFPASEDKQENSLRK